MDIRQRSAWTLATLVTVTALIACADSASPIATAGGDAPQAIDASGRTDSGRPRTDTTRPRPDTGAPPRDTGGTPPDTGGTPPDTGGTPPDTGGTPPDTGHAPPDTVTSPPDTTRDALIAGDVYGIDSTTNPARISPLSGVTVTLFGPVPAPGTGGDSALMRGDSVATDRTGAMGRFDFAHLLPGWYRLRAVPPAGSGFATGHVLVTAYSIRSLVLRTSVRIYLTRQR